jgi:hypothetical protein
MYTDLWSEYLKGRNNLENQDVDGMLILKWNFKYIGLEVLGWILLVKNKEW